jgi:hypothetical protein
MRFGNVVEERVIESLMLKFGRNTTANAEAIPISAVTIFVGPNNSGKSKALREIEAYCYSGNPQPTDNILAQMSFVGLPPLEIPDVIERIRKLSNLGETIAPDHIWIHNPNIGRHPTHRPQLEQLLQEPMTNPQGFCQLVLGASTLRLDATSRISLIAVQGAGDFQQPPQGTLPILFRNVQKRENVRRIIYDAFQKHLVIDPTLSGHLRLRLSNRAPRDEMEEQGLHPNAIAFHGAAQLIDEFSDGVKAFTGIITTMVAGDPQVILIDEPEAFLYPPLAAKLGLELSRTAQANKKRVFASTHSPSFLMGCIQSGTPVNIIRLTYRDGAATARVLPPAELTVLMRDPLLRSNGVLNALFYESVIVTESDADRAFYQEINERLLQFKPEWGIPNCLFLHAQNKQTTQKILGPLRKLGIPTASVIDVDILKDGGKDWTNHLSSANVPTLQHSGLGDLRSKLNIVSQSTGKNMKRDGGIAILPLSEQEAAKNLFDQLAEYGIFVIPGGELESWLKPLGASGHGPPWLVSMFEMMGEDQNHAGYLKPDVNDVWEFISSIRTWLLNPNRKGIPA